MGRTGTKFEAFIEIVRELRRKCPWDREQTIETIKPYLVEEVYEAVQAIDDKDTERLAEELGDMLLHVVMLSVFAKEDGYFNINDVISGISAKMIRRHPHVFAKGKAKTKEDVWLKWEKIKQSEKKKKGQAHKSILESIPRHLPALYRAEKVQRRAARIGFDWSHVAGAWDKVHEELDEVKSEIKKPKLKAGPKSQIKNSKLKEEIGDLLFAIVNVARKLEIDAEDALQLANTKFMKRFSRIERQLQKRKLTLKEMDALWDRAKASETL
ncbi:MAG: nucleoside triphosphate pyrophosphohydrolase [Candidatus Saganbacteria bacterium]|nr:nucleoside triphosphate pyrophosphohydrolase [Candidatus Saganbacteria bacterium]